MNEKKRNNVPSWAQRTKADKLAIEQGYWWDQQAGERVLKFVEEYLVLETGKPFKLLDWQKDLILQTFAWKRPDGLRRIKTLFLTCSKKQGKTQILAALTAYMLLADGEMSPFCVSAANDREQAAQVYSAIEWSIRNSPRLREVCHTVPSKKEILYPKRNGKYKSLSCDVASKHGANCSFVVYDELAFAPKDELYQSLRYASVARPNGLQAVISTAGHNKNGIFYTLYRYAKAILEGTETDLTFLPFVYETPDDADLDNPDTWKLSNPSLGVSQSVEDFKADYQKARFDTAELLNFKRLRLNMWTDAETVWIPVDRWDQCKGTLPNLADQPVYLGADIGATTDLTAVAAVWPLNGKYYVQTWGFVPQSAVEKRDKMNLVRYQQFTQDGSLIVTRGTATDFANLKRFILSLRDRYDVRSFTVDRWNAIQLANELMQEGLTVYQMPQHHSYLNEPTKTLERLVLDGKIVHDGNSLLRWQIGHTLLDVDGKGLAKPITQSEHNKKDNLMALIMALSQAVQHEQHINLGRSVYDDRGLVFV